MMDFCHDGRYYYQWFSFDITLVSFSDRDRNISLGVNRSRNIAVGGGSFHQSNRFYCH